MWRRKREPASLNGFDVKVERARLHLDALHDANQRLLLDPAYKFVGQIYRNGLDHVYFADNPPSPDATWALIIGDCVHNLRSALDHLAWQLVILAGNTPTEQTQFPISPKLCTPKVAGGISGQATRLIESIQPKHRRNPIGERLWRIRVLDIIDKHRQLLAVAAVVRLTGTTWDAVHGSPPPDSAMTYSRVGLEHKKMAVKFTFETPQLDLDPNLNLFSRIAFDKAETLVGGQDATKVLEDLIVCLETDIRPLFAPLFPATT